MNKLETGSIINKELNKVYDNLDINAFRLALIYKEYYDLFITFTEDESYMSEDDRVGYIAFLNESLNKIHEDLGIGYQKISKNYHEAMFNEFKRLRKGESL